MSKDREMCDACKQGGYWVGFDLDSGNPCPNHPGVPFGYMGPTRQPSHSFVESARAVWDKIRAENRVKIQVVSDSTVVYGAETIGGETVPYRDHHAVTYKYADDGSCASRNETTTRTYVGNEPKDGEFEMDIDPYPKKDES